ncbi:MAG TPA: hypothetical protein VGD67_01270 [Pseudonocardiaceae bacterium]
MTDALTTVLARLRDAVRTEADGDPYGDTDVTWREPGPGYRPEDLNALVDDHWEPERARTVATLADGADGADGEGLAAVYADVLRRCLVMRGELTGEERLKLGRYRDLVRGTGTFADPVTGAVRPVPADGPMLRAYRERRAAYLSAELGHNLARAAGGPDWAEHGDRYRDAVKRARDAWICSGYRDELDQVVTYLRGVTERDLVRWRRYLVELCDSARVDTAGGSFHLSSLVPGDLSADSLWHEVRLDGITLRVARAEVSRPWFLPVFLHGRGWALPGDELVCDGGDPPSGRLVRYPTAVLLARDLRLDPALACDATTWGPFTLGVPGLQVIGTVDRRLGRVPDPSPGQLGKLV